SYDPATTFFDDPPPVGCTFDDPGCWVTFDADDELIKLDPDLIPLCADLPEWLKFEEVSILAHYPTLDGQPDTWAPGTFPVTVLGTGNFISVAAYQGLATHLARSGGTIVLVVSPTTNQGFVSSRGEMAHCIRRLVEASELELLGEPIFDHWDGRFAHGGHSRGGEAAVVANALDHDFALAPADAVFGLA